MSDNQQIQQAPQVLEAKEIIEKSSNTKLKRSKKFQRFLELYNDPNSPTFGNGTRSVLEAYQLDPKTQYQIAGQIAHENMKKLEDIAEDFYERNDMGINKILKAVYFKAVSPKFANPGWLDRYLMLQGHEIKKTPDTQVNVQINNYTGKEEDKKDYDVAFQKFLESGGAD